MIRVLVVASEVSPYAKSGGLGDVTGSLPGALKKAGVDVRVLFPKYKTIAPIYTDSAEYVDTFEVILGWRRQVTKIYRLAADVPTYMLENNYYFNRDGYYGYGDDNERFSYFSKAAIEFLDCIDFVPDIIHCNDWQTAPICVYLKDFYGRYLSLSKIKTLFTIHNLQYQGSFGKETLGMMDLNDGYFTSDKLELNNMVCFMKAGLLYSDAVSTVSRTYADEIQTPQYGYGLDGVLRCRQNALYGIVNGIDYDQNDPRTSRKIYANFSIDDMSGKKVNKTELQKELGLPQNPDVPLFSLISRLAEQKGIDLVLEAMEGLLQRDIQFVMLGTGEGKYEDAFKNLAARYPGKVSSNIRFSDVLAQKIYAGSDMFLMPSLFEPCGLGQLFAMSYGTVPITRTTGGLVDTVKHYSKDNPSGSGFQFQDYVASGLVWAVERALEAYADKEAWAQVVHNAMSTRFSWDKSAQEYIEVYKKILGK